MRVKDIHMGDPNMVILHIYGPKNHSQRPLAMPFGMGFHQYVCLSDSGRNGGIHS